MQDEDTITTKFRAKIPLTLQSASSSIAALHAIRVRYQNHPASAEIFSSTHCTKCGTYLLDGTGSVRIVRKSLSRKAKKRAVGQPPYVRVLRRTCSVCHGEEDRVVSHAGPSAVLHSSDPQQSQPFPLPNPPPYLLRQKTVANAKAPTSGSTPSSSSRILASLPASSPTIAVQTPSTSSYSSRSSTPNAARSSPSLENHAKPRAKKKTGLQEMLARNRERQEQENKTKSGSSLTAFLEGL